MEHSEPTGEEGRHAGTILVEQSEDPGKSSRIARGIPVVPAFDGYRTIAVLGIVILHTLQVAGVRWLPEDGGLNRLLWAGDLGQTCLDMLFITSGFVLFLPTAIRGGRFGSAGNFAILRFARLLPAYWLVLLIMLLLIPIIDLGVDFPGPAEIVMTFGTIEVPAELFHFTYNLGFGINRAIWTLSLEVTFYILLPLLALKFFRRPLIGLAIAAAIAVVWRLIMNDVSGFAELFGFHVSAERATQLDLTSEIEFPFWITSFAAGMLCAKAYARTFDRPDAERVRRLAAWGQLGSLAWLAITVLLIALVLPEHPRHSPVFALMFTAGLGSFMLSTALAPPAFQALFSNRVARSVADSSYGMYLIHLVVIAVVGSQLTMVSDGSTEGALKWLAWVLPVSIAFGYFSATVVERPIRRWAHRKVKRRRSASA